MSIETTGLSKLEISYQTLISNYNVLLEFVASDRIHWASRWIVRPMIEDHIRIILREIINAFTLYEYHLLDTIPNENLSWLRQEADYLTRLADQLANFRQLLRTFAWRGLTILFASAVIRFAGSTNQTQDVEFILNNLWGIVNTLLASSFTFFLLLGLFAVAAAMVHLKRTYLIKEPDSNDQSGMSSSIPDKGFNIYKLENDLFQKLDRHKPKETPWDVWVLVLSCIYIAVAAVVIFPHWEVLGVTAFEGILIPVITIYGMVVLIRFMLARER